MGFNGSDTLTYVVTLPMLVIILLAWMLMIKNNWIIRNIWISLLNDPRIPCIFTLNLNEVILYRISKHLEITFINEM